MTPKDKKKIILAVLVIFFGVISRLFFNEKISLPNFEAITAFSLLSGSFFGGFYSIFIPLLVISLSDILLGNPPTELHFGNTPIYFFTWSAFILIGLLGILLKRNSKYYFFKITAMGIISVLFFYLWTNFGWWLISGMYPITLQGLIQCYIAGLPFLKNQLFSAFIFVPIFSLIFSLVFDKILAPKVSGKLITSKLEN